jgi:tetratricopeptide (TPR) repeat protein
MNGGKMRTIIATLVGAALVAVCVDCTKSATKGPAWTRWGFTKPTTEREAEPRLADAHRLLYDLKLDSAQAAYQDLVGRYPQSAEALLGLSLVYRYSGKWDTALTEARAAFKLDSVATGVLLSYADLMLPIRTGPIPVLDDSVRYVESERCNLKAAASTHPFNAHAHVSLWATYMVQGRLSEARHQASELSRKGYYRQPLLDFARNLLVGLEPNAILFTSGDNDTYPLWALQQARDPFRPDVTVANLGLLNIPAVVQMMKDSLGLPVSLTDDEILALAPRESPTGMGMELPSQQVVDNVIANAAGAGRPVYFAVTVRNVISSRYDDRLVLEGLVNRVAEDKPAAPVDLDRINENLTKNYRLDWPEPLPPWPQNMSPLTRMVAPTALNYATIYDRLTAHYDAQGKTAEAAAYCPDAVKWMLRGDRKQAAIGFVGAWLLREPDNAAAKKLKAELEKAD